MAKIKKEKKMKYGPFLKSLISYRFRIRDANLHPAYNLFSCSVDKVDIDLANKSLNVVLRQVCEPEFMETMEYFLRATPNLAVDFLNPRFEASNPYYSILLKECEVKEYKISLAYDKDDELKNYLKIEFKSFNVFHPLNSKVGT